MTFMRKHMKLLTVGAVCAAAGGGAGAIATAGAAGTSTAGTSTAATSTAHVAAAQRARRALARHAIQGDMVVATENGFATVTFNRGFVQSVNGQQPTIREGTKEATYKAVTLTIPTNAKVRDNGQRATLSQLIAGQRVGVVQEAEAILGNRGGASAVLSGSRLPAVARPRLRAPRAGRLGWFPRRRAKVSGQQGHCYRVCGDPQSLKLTSSTRHRTEGARRMSAHGHDDHEHNGPGYASPAVARQQPAEKFVYVASLYEGTGIERPDFIAVVDVDPDSARYGQIVHRTEMPNVGDELHHFGWNACSSACHSQLPGTRCRSGHAPLAAPHRRHLRAAGAADQECDRGRGGQGEVRVERAAHGALHAGRHRHDLDVGRCGRQYARWVRGARRARFLDRRALGARAGGIEFMYDFWYQPRQNTLISSEWAAPNTFLDGFNPADVAAGKYGRKLHFWDLEQRKKVQTIDLGNDGLIPLEIRWQHDPDSAQGFVGATLSSNIIHFHRNGSWGVSKAIDVANEELEGWPLEGGVPGLITDLVLSLDDKDLFFSNWLHGDLRHYDVSDPANPQLKSQVWLGGLLGRDGGHPKARGALNGGPQMIQNSLDGDRVYVTNSLFSTWDNQFYPGIEGWLVKLDRQSDGTYAPDPSFFVDFHEQADGARPHEIHLPGGDCTTEIFQ